MYVVDETSIHVLGEEFGGWRALINVLVEAVSIPHVVGPLQQVRDPTDTTFGHRDLQLRMAMEDGREEQIGGGVHRVAAEQRDGHRERGFRGRLRRLARCAEMQTQRDVSRLARREEGVPMFGMV